MNNTKFVAYFYFIGFDHISFGLHLCLSVPNIEIHLPFGFIRIGFHCNSVRAKEMKKYKYRYRAYGITNT